MFTFPVGFWNPVSGGGGSDPHANNVVLFLKADQSSLITNTTTSANFTVPAVNSTVTVDVISSAWAAANRAIRIGNGAGNYIVTNVNSGTQITIMNCGGSDNASVGTTINSGATVALSIIDSSPTPKILDAFGNVQLSTVQSKYNGSSIYFDGSGDYLSTPGDASLVFGTNNFCIEFYIYFISFGTYLRIVSNRQIGAGANGSWGVMVTNEWMYLAEIIGGEPGILAYFPSLLTPSNHHHLAVCRESGLVRFFLNGFLIGSGEFSRNFNFLNTLYIGGVPGDQWTNGYISCLRITNGIARYTTNFNPETDTYLN